MTERIDPRIQIGHGHLKAADLERALGASNRLITWHPSYLALSPCPKVRQRQYRALLAPSADPRTDARDPRWTQRAVGSPTFVARYVPRRGRRRIGIAPTQNQEVRS